MTTWIWPFSLYDHIRQLEEIIVKLMNDNAKLKQQLLEAQRRSDSAGESRE